MSVLITGGSGFVGSMLIDKLVAKGERVISVSRHSPELKENQVPMVGDILKPNLGLDDATLHYVSQYHGKIRAVYHLAALMKLGQDRDGSIWRTNVSGTQNVIDFCVRHEIRHLFFCSTAYTQGKNPYEWSKIRGELLVTESPIPETTIFKPSIVMAMPEQFYEEHFFHYVRVLIKVHRRTELLRKLIEGTLRLPLLEPVFRLKGNPEGYLNLVSVEDVTDAMAANEKPGVYWLTNPNPSTLNELSEWVGEFIKIQLRIERDFHPTPLEAAFQRLTRPFQPYLEGDSFPSHLHDCKVDKELVQGSIKNLLY